MLLKDISTEFETHKVIEYEKDGISVVRKNITMQRIKENLFKGKNYNEYGTDYCNLYVVYENYSIGYVAGRYVYATSEIDDIFDKFKQSPFYSETMFISYMDSKTDIEKDWIQNTEIQLASYFAPEKVSRYTEIKKQMKEYRDKKSTEKAEKVRQKDAKFVLEANQIAENALTVAKEIILNGGILKNEKVEFYQTRYDYHSYSIINYLMRQYGINVPIRTQGWINDKLSSVSIKNEKCDSLCFYKIKGAQGSQKFFDCMNELIVAVNENEKK